MDHDLTNLFHSIKAIAVVGISDKPDRSSYGVAEYLAQYFEIIPVNPRLNEWQGRPAFRRVSDIPLNRKVDLVDVFRRSEDMMPVADDVVLRGQIPYFWMQQGIWNNEAAQRLTAAGVQVVMDRCIAVEHSRLRAR